MMVMERPAPALPKVIVEFTPGTYQTLNLLAQHEGINKTTVVNRAVQVYNLLFEAQREGRNVWIEDEDGVLVKFTLVEP